MFAHKARKRIIVFFVILCNSLQAILQRIQPHSLRIINMLSRFYLFLCKIVGGWQKGDEPQSRQNGKKYGTRVQRIQRNIYIYTIYLILLCFSAGILCKFGLQRITKKYKEIPLCLWIDCQRTKHLWIVCQMTKR